MASRPLLDQFRPLLGMVHLAPSPGVPGFEGLATSRERAVADARTLIDAGFQGLVLENFHDFPPVPESQMGPEIPAYFTALAVAVRAAVGTEVPIGVQVLFAAHRVALATCLAAGLDFIRAEAWTHAHVSDKGWVDASAGTSVRYAQQIGAGAVRVFADVKKKHASHAVTADLSAGDIAAGMAEHGADAVVVTGATTGSAPSEEELRDVRSRTELPIVIGSGVGVQNASSLMAIADGAIVGSGVKVDGDWRNPVDLERARALVRCIEHVR